MMKKLLRLLLVDDEKLILRGLEETYDWESMGYEVVGTALDGDIALEMLEDTMPDIIITDISMKRVNGLELMEETKRRNPNIEFVVLSAYKDFEYAQEAIRNGALQYLIKPMPDQELSKVMDEVYDKCMTKKMEKESYTSWKKFLLEDKNNFLSIMTKKYLDEGMETEELEKIYQGLGMKDFLNRKIVVVCADLEPAYQIIHQEEYNEKRHVLGRMMKGALEERFEIQYFTLTDGCQVYILFLKEQANGLLIKNIVWKIEKELMNVCVSSISNCYNGLREMKQAYHEALEFFEIACEAGASALTFSENTQISNIPRYSIDIENQLLQAIRSEDEKQLKKACERFVYLLPDEEKGKIYLHRLMMRVEILLVESENMSLGFQKNFENFYSYLPRFQLTKLIDLAYKLLQEIIQQKKLNVSKVSETLFQDYIKQAVIYVKEHLADEELSVSKVAEWVHLNPVYFGRVFKTVYGMSLKKYILDLRIEKAKELLTEGNYNITIIGSLVGIPNSSYFTKIFRENTGKLPSDYQKG